MYARTQMRRRIFTRSQQYSVSARPSTHWLSKVYHSVERSTRCSYACSMDKITKPSQSTLLYVAHGSQESWKRYFYSGRPGLNSDVQETWPAGKMLLLKLYISAALNSTHEQSNKRPDDRQLHPPDLQPLIWQPYAEVLTSKRQPLTNTGSI